MMKMIRMRMMKRFTKMDKGNRLQKEKKIACYICKKLGQNKSKRKKAMIATWSNSDTSNDDDSNDEGIDNLCFMALEEPKVSSNSCDFNFYTFNVLQNVFDELAVGFETMNSKYKKMISKLKVENDFLVFLKARMKI
ncbi:zf-CCHC domain-containing protein/UBN2 domain-containing protein [Gossypium australe]|uniref:Zf-CCHC domain-containing protein/UBN2 domain-containing protein n=1 Tax=Gossypium australe TaxID=47621 RepID=A0A5B6VG00_9ROSI|nr:zf-CCHC domain-containing protein/UBN2 domain-containing protein [Gossypium australe]